MKLEKIISFANKTSQLRFLAMERSLRNTGCELPVWVIPFDDNKFDLPANCIWWEMPEVTALLNKYNIDSMKRKYQCFLTKNYQYVDADVIFLRNPETVLASMSGFVTSCCHWNNPEHTYVESTFALFKQRSTTWQKSTFNSGQFACDEVFYDLEGLEQFITDPASKEALATHDQISINLLVFLSKVQVNNITLPPYNMESTWAGDYPDEDYERYWGDETRKPYLIHWAGLKIAADKPIDKLFTNYLTESEKTDLYAQLTAFKESREHSALYYLSIRLKAFIKRIIS